MSVQQQAVFIGANRQGHVADVSEDLIAYGAGTTVALWNTLARDHRGVYHTLNHHTKEVTCVRFLEDLLISAGEDGVTAVWRPYNDGQIKYTLQQSIDQECSVTALATAGKVFITGNTIGDIRVWKQNTGVFECVHSFHVRRNFLPGTLALHKIGNVYLIAVGGTAHDIFIYSYDESGIYECATLTGHEDWVKCLSIVTEREGLDYLLASGSQDRYIRLWRMRLNEAIDDSDEDDTQLVLLSNKQHKFTWGTGRAAISLEALIMGHDDWVTGLQWRPDGRRQLLSLSADTALMIWEMDEHLGIWVCVSRLGELSIKGASTATGASGGFWSCLWFAVADTQYIVANGKTGSIRVFRSIEDKNDYTKDGNVTDNNLIDDHTSAVDSTNNVDNNDNSAHIDDNTTNDTVQDHWEPCLGVTGPIREATCVAWEHGYLLTTSLDQTTRLIAPWIHGSISWHEFARPQIHGYDMICVAPMTATRFVSGGDEKVMRVFDMTQAVGQTLREQCGIDVGDNLRASAALPVLGLSNKADPSNINLASQSLDQSQKQQSLNQIDTTDALAQHSLTSHPELSEAKPDLSNTDMPSLSDPTVILAGEPPLEDALQRHTLFPEADKIYGHGYEITCCAASHGLIASACRSNSTKHAVIRVFDNLRPTATLLAHTLTVTGLAFSPDGALLAAVSRDRLVSVWRGAKLVAHVRAHTRIVWACAWVLSRVLVTGLRDRHIKVWQVEEGDEENKITEYNESERAVGDGEDSSNIASAGSYAPAITTGTSDSASTGFDAAAVSSGNNVTVISGDKNVTVKVTATVNGNATATVTVATPTASAIATTIPTDTGVKKDGQITSACSDGLHLISSLKTADAVTALACAGPIIACGHESGAISIYKFDTTITKIADLDTSIIPAARVSSLSWRHHDTDDCMVLAAASADHSVRLYTVEV